MPRKRETDRWRTKRTPLTLLLSGFLLLSGCDCFHSSQFRIRPAGDRTAGQEKRETEKVTEVLRSTADRFGFEDRTARVTIKGAFCCFAEPTNNLPFAHWALFYDGRTVDGSILVDASLWNPGCARKRRKLFLEVEKSLATGLSNVFGGRVVAIRNQADRIPIEHVRPSP